MTDGDNLPTLVSSELGECESIWHFQGVLVLRDMAQPPMTANPPVKIAIVNILLPLIVRPSLTFISHDTTAGVSRYAVP